MACPIDPHACADCHADVADFAGLKATLPRVENGELVTLTNLVNECRTDRMGADAWKYSGGKMSAMTALIAHQSRGMAMNVQIHDLCTDRLYVFAFGEFYLFGVFFDRMLDLDFASDKGAYERIAKEYQRRVSK